MSEPVPTEVERKDNEPEDDRKVNQRQTANSGDAVSISSIVGEGTVRIGREPSQVGDVKVESDDSVGVEAGEIVKADDSVEVEVSSDGEPPTEAESNAPVESELSGTRPIPMQLPPKIAPFAGQEKIVAELSRTLQPGKVIGLWGPGGMGKSVVAGETLLRLSGVDSPPPQFPDGIVWYDFRSQPWVKPALEHIANAFGEDPEPTAEEAARRILKDKKALLVFDEVDEAAREFKLILSISRSCGILMIARDEQSLEAADELVELSRLTESDAVDLLQKLAGEQANDVEGSRELVQLLDYRSWSISFAAEIMRLKNEPVRVFNSRLRESKGNPRTTVNRQIPIVNSHIDRATGALQQVLSVIGLFEPDAIDAAGVAAAIDVPEEEARQTLDELVGSGFLRLVDGHYKADVLVYRNVKEMQPPDGAELRLAIFQATVEPGLLVDYNGDSALGEEDMLDIDRDVDAFAALIASKNVTPPLSIGVFGDWGSGKTFFMRRLKARVDAIACAARSIDDPESEQMQKDIEFYKRIVQVEFNAWHYVEGNLWASLVEHILRNLQIDPDEDATALQRRRKSLLAKLEEVHDRQGIFKKRKEELQQELEKKQQELDQLNVAYQQKVAELEYLSAQGVLGAVDIEDLDPQVRQTLDQLGAGGVYNDALDFASALSDLHGTLSRGNALLTPMRQRGWRWTLLLILFACLGPLVAYGLIKLNTALAIIDVTPITNALISVSTLLTALTVLLKLGNSWLSKAITRVEKAQVILEEAKKEVEADYLAQVAALQRDVRETQRAYEQARLEEQAAAQEIAEIELELQGLTPGRALMEFIEERVGSDDYRRHLGVVAIIRRDFEILSSSIEEENSWLESDAVSTLAREKEDEEARINRIVLYIDDLDRCPPQRVVEVLQAIHLILAFPLFVVVVGVDGRWVSRSLQEHYKTLLGSNDKGSTTEGDVLAGRDAGPHDYLEKIFQIPFWLEPLDESRSQAMLAGLLKQPVTRPEAPEFGFRRSERGAAAADVQPAGGSSMEQVGSAVAGEPAAQEGAAPVGDGEVFLDAAQPGTLTTSEPRQTADRSRIDLTPQAMEVEPNEALFMGALAPILSRSPRSLKRFVNTYRLIKAGVEPAKQKGFMAGSGPSSQFQAVMFLLAVVTGLPKISQHFFELLMEEEASKSDLKSIVDDPDWPSLDQEALREKQNLARWLEDNGEPWDSADLHIFREWAPHVAQYSFRVERLGRANNGQNGDTGAVEPAPAGP